MHKGSLVYNDDVIKNVLKVNYNILEEQTKKLSFLKINSFTKSETVAPQRINKIYQR